jgi:hypothetical protein
MLIDWFGDLLFPLEAVATWWRNGCFPDLALAALDLTWEEPKFPPWSPICPGVGVGETRLCCVQCCSWSRISMFSFILVPLLKLEDN